MYFIQVRTCESARVRNGATIWLVDQSGFKQATCNNGSGKSIVSTFTSKKAGRNKPKEQTNSI
jgi:hypothetical protein